MSYDGTPLIAMAFFDMMEPEEVGVMTEPVWVPVSSERLSGEGVLVERKLFPFFNYPAQEAYLEEMSAKGWHLRQKGPGGWAYTFVSGPPQKVCYHVDFGYANWGCFFRKFFDVSPRPWIKCQPYDGDRPENRDALLSQMIQYKFTLFMYGPVLLINSLLLAIVIFSILSTVGMGGMQASSIEPDALHWFYQTASAWFNVATIALFYFLGIFLILYLVILVLTIVILLVRLHRAKQRLDKAY